MKTSDAHVTQPPVDLHQMWLSNPRPSRSIWKCWQRFASKANAAICMKTPNHIYLRLSNKNINGCRTCARSGDNNKWRSRCVTKNDQLKWNKKVQESLKANVFLTGFGMTASPRPWATVWTHKCACVQAERSCEHRGNTCCGSGQTQATSMP